MQSGTLAVETSMCDDPNVNTYSITAKVNLEGQCSNVNARLHKWGTSTSSHVTLDLQKRHRKARFVMHLASDHTEAVRLKIITKSPGYVVPTYEKTLGMDGALSWQFCSFLGKEISSETIWEIWAPNVAGTQNNQVLRISFEPCEDDKVVLLGESFGLPDGGSEKEDKDIGSEDTAHVTAADSGKDVPDINVSSSQDVCCSQLKKQRK